MIEQRKHPRYEAHSLIKYKKLDDPLSSWQTGPEIKNISLGGLLFSAYEKMSIGTPLIFKLQIFVEDSSAKIVELHAKVVGVEDGIVSYDTRVAFTDLNASQKTLLKKFINYVES
ncbi:MAG: PilZ domain-containing protein [Candidatus Omnitrophota bacterium]